MELHPYLQNRMEQLVLLCKKHKVSKLYAFGSIVTGRFDLNKSDIDLQVELMQINDPVEKGLTLLELWDALETLFERKVDLVSDQPIQNHFFKSSLDQIKVLIYDRALNHLPIVKEEAKKYLETT